MAKFHRQLLSAAALALILVLSACHSRPSKYKKKRGCDCPKWNHKAPSHDRGIHAILAPEFGTPDPPFGTVPSA